jgi:UDP-glucose 4-epimerase
VRPSPATLVVGAGGLLGRHVSARLERAGSPVTAAVVPWGDRAGAPAALRSAVDTLRHRADARPWNIAWCAGAGVVATAPEVLAEEQSVFEALMAHLGRVVGPDDDGALFLASSAGGVYAGSEHPPFTESTQPRPLAPYGRVKLAMEDAARSFADLTGTPVLVGRISNLYGPGQDLTKPQGLVSQLCRAHTTREPVSIYVSLDTRRDYLFVGDCADMVVDGLAGLREHAGTGVVTKILSSGRSTTIATLIGESTRLFRRRPRVVVRSPSVTGAQVRDLRVESLVWRELDRHARTPLPVGMSLTAADVERRLVAATRPSPRGSP